MITIKFSGKYFALNDTVIFEIIDVYCDRRFPNVSLKGNEVKEIRICKDPSSGYGRIQYRNLTAGTQAVLVSLISDGDEVAP
jgi:hypothetical protein